MDTQPVAFSWRVETWADVVGLVALALILVGGVIVIVSILSREGFRLGNFRAGLRRQKDDGKAGHPVGIVTEHENLLKKLASSDETILKILQGISIMQEAQNEALNLVLGHMKGEKFNGELDAVRIKLSRAEGFQEAVQPREGG